MAVVGAPLAVLLAFAAAVAAAVAQPTPPQRPICCTYLPSPDKRPKLYCQDQPGRPSVSLALPASSSIATVYADSSLVMCRGRVPPPAARAATYYLPVTAISHVDSGAGAGASNRPPSAGTLAPPCPGAPAMFTAWSMELAPDGTFAVRCYAPMARAQAVANGPLPPRRLRVLAHNGADGGGGADVAFWHGGLLPRLQQAARRLQQQAACACPSTRKPVCTSDGRRFENKCLAECVGAVVTSSTYCLLPSDPVGTSLPYPEPYPEPYTSKPTPAKPGQACACPLIYAPVCGADGVTYDSACAATRCGGGTSVASKGPCPGDANSQELLVVPNGGSGRPRGGPAARSPPPPPPKVCACSRAYTPVCGRDGRTYSNSCLAKCEGVAVAANGACAARTPSSGGGGGSGGGSSLGSTGFGSGGSSGFGSSSGGSFGSGGSSGVGGSSGGSSGFLG